jgi:mersacidin/lichenicidin family type 2 lantibiotic
MIHDPIIRAWKDPRYRRSLTAAEREALPPHPAGASNQASRRPVEAGGPPISERFFTFIALTVNTCC